MAKAKVATTKKPTAKATSKKPAAAKVSKATKATGGKAAAPKKPARAAAPPKKVAAGKSLSKPAGKAAPGASARARAATVEAYAESLPAWQARVVTRLRNLMASASPGSQESIKDGQTIYEVNGPFAYVKALGNAVNFGFWRGADLDDPGKLLISDGPRRRHVQLVESGEFPEERLVAFIQQAVVLNLVNGDPTEI